MPSRSASALRRRRLRAEQAAPAADEFASGLVVDDALVVRDVAVHDVAAELGPADVRVLLQLAEEAGVGPAQGGLGLLRGHRVASVRLQGAQDLEVAHQAGVQPDQLELVQPGALLDLAQRPVQLIEVEHVAQALLERYLRAAAAGRGRVAPPTGPAHAVVGQDQRVLVGGIGLHRPGDEVDQGLAVGHVGFAEVSDFLGVDDVQVVILSHMEAFG